MSQSLVTAPAVTYSEPLAGPWVAVLTDHLGYVYPTVHDAREALGVTGAVIVSVVRGAALPVAVDGGGAVARIPDDIADADVAYELGCRLADDDEWPAAGPTARYMQARAMADGLNLAGMPVLTVSVDRGLL